MHPRWAAVATNKEEADIRPFFCSHTVIRTDLIIPRGRDRGAIGPGRDAASVV